MSQLSHEVTKKAIKAALTVYAGMYLLYESHLRTCLWNANFSKLSWSIPALSPSSNTSFNSFETLRTAVGQNR